MHKELPELNGKIERLHSEVFLFRGTFMGNARDRSPLYSSGAIPSLSASVSLPAPTAVPLLE